MPKATQTGESNLFCSCSGSFDFSAFDTSVVRYGGRTQVSVESAARCKYCGLPSRMRYSKISDSRE